ncbi:MAG: monofunctional biosynthetic peptidoglycan transglycosylase, partial [Candidatus Binatia bacterium]
HRGRSRSRPGAFSEPEAFATYPLLIAVRTLLRWAFYCLLAFYGGSTVSLLYVKFFHPFTTTVHLQRRIESFFTPGHYAKRYTFVPLDRVSDHLEHAVIAAEDGRFFQHGGIDWQELEKAVHKDWPRGRLRGASTITQQLVKNLFLTTHQLVLRKALELPLVVLAELILSKERILALYLNVIEWGPGVYGAEAASQYHYGIPAAQLSRAQAARLAACIPSPRTRTPPEMDSYSAEILDRMSHMGW